MTQKTIQIAVDGPAGAGKSTAAKMLARTLGCLYLDTGAMYRAVTLGVLDSGTDLTDPQAIARQASRCSVDFGPDGRVLLNGKDVEDEIRTSRVARHTSDVAPVPEVRSQLTDQMRRIAGDRTVIMDGRDIGTVVFPGADIKIFLVSRQEIRADRRHRELVGKGLQVDFSEVMKNISERDRIDQSRTESPLRQAEDAVLLDNSNMTPEEQMKWFRNLIENRYHAGEH